MHHRNNRLEHDPARSSDLIKHESVALTCTSHDATVKFIIYISFAGRSERSSPRRELPSPSWANSLCSYTLSLTPVLRGKTHTLLHTPFRHTHTQTKLALFRRQCFLKSGLVSLFVLPKPPSPETT